MNETAPHMPPSAPSSQAQYQPWQPVASWPPPGGYPTTAETYGGGHSAFGPPPAAPPSAWRRRAVSAVTLVAVSLGSGWAGAQFADSNPGAPAFAPVVTVAAAEDGGPREQLARVAAAVQPSVVSIAVAGRGGSGTGSGVILSSDGTILTNNHVVAAAASGGRLMVKFADGKVTDASIVGRDPGSDLAVIRAEGVSGLTPATLGDPAAVHVGDTVLALGSPLGLDGSVSAGIVSALERPVALGGGAGSDTAYISAIQTDAPINPGNSGGALVDSSGRVIGINSAILTLGGGVPGATSGNIGLGFAIPIDTANEVAGQLQRGEQPRRAALGVQMDDAPGTGALVTALVPGGAAAGAGMRPGDVITRIGDRTIDDATALAAVVRSHRPGDRVPVTYERNGRALRGEITLGRADS